MKKFVLILLIMLFTCTALLSCGGGEINPVAERESPGGFNADGDNDSDDTPAAAESTKLLPDLPEADFDGAIINFLVRGEDYHWYWSSREIYAENETGEPVNDAVYRRNRYVEDKYNFEIKEYRSAIPFNDASRAVRAGDDTYDVFMIGLGEGANLAQGGHLVNLYAMPHIDLLQPWWDQRAVSDLIIGGKIYYALGDINIMDNDSTFVTFFNKKLIADHGMEMPYQFARDGEWTLDIFNQMIMEVSRDLNGDGIMGPEDLFGHLTEASGSYNLFVGAGGRIALNNAGNYPELTINNENTSAIIDKILITMGNRNFTLLADDYSGQFSNPWDELTRPMFKNNQGLFYSIGMGTANLMRDMEVDFGILPLPKFDKNQSEYYNPVGPGSTTSVCVPVSGSNINLTGFALEAMAAESMYTLTEAYYTINFENKSLRDEESIEMMKIILNTRAYDLGHVFGFGDFHTIFDSMTRRNTNTFASDYERRAERAQRDIDRLIESFNN